MTTSNSLIPGYLPSSHKQYTTCRRCGGILYSNDTFYDNCFNCRRLPNQDSYRRSLEEQVLVLNKEMSEIAARSGPKIYDVDIEIVSPELGRVSIKVSNEALNKTEIKTLICRAHTLVQAIRDKANGTRKETERPSGFDNAATKEISREISE